MYFMIFIYFISFLISSDFFPAGFSGVRVTKFVENGWGTLKFYSVQVFMSNGSIFVAKAILLFKSTQ